MVWGTRHTFAIIAFLGNAIDYFMRVNLPITIVAMVKEQSNREASKNLTTVCSEGSMFASTNISIPEKMYHGDFEWSSAEQGVILGAFYYGYVLTQLLGGYLTEKFGGKWVVIGSLSTASALNFAFPTVVKYSAVLFSALRLVQGMAAGMSFVSIYGMTSVWIPKEERSTIIAIVLAGCHIGIIIALPMCALIADEFGWENVFYFSGAITAAVVLLWYFLAFSYPSCHPRITQVERDYIENNTGALSGLKKLPRPPYAAIFKSPAVISLIVGLTGGLWGLYIVITGIPTYLANVQNVDLKTNGVASAIPYICCYTTSYLWAFLFKLLVTKKLMNHSSARKFINSVSLYGQSIGLIVLSFIGCDQVLAIVILCFIMGTNSAIMCGMMQNPVDLAPNYASTVLAIVNTISNTCGFFTPMATGFITDEAHTFEAWRTVFWLAAAVMTAVNTQYIIFGQFKEQSWNTYWMEKDDLND